MYGKGFYFLDGGEIAFWLDVICQRQYEGGYSSIARRVLAQLD
jgi:hypothetical protein